MAEAERASQLSGSGSNGAKRDKIPTVSIGMPVYNGERFIREALESLLNQTYRDFELIISDNASTDSTSAICVEYAARDQRIRYIRQAENIGPSANFRFVFDESTGQYFMWAAHDDVRSLDYIEAALRCFKPNDACIAGSADLVDWDGRLVRKMALSSFNKNACFKFFMESEYKSRTMYMYGVFSAAALRSADWATISHEQSYWHWNDAHFLYSILPFGALRSLHGPYIIYKLKSDKASRKAASVKASWPRWKQLFLAHPPSYYKRYWALTPENQRVWLLLLIPVKVLKSQLDIWAVVVKRLVALVARRCSGKESTG